MTISLILLTAVIILLMFGAGQRILDSLRLNDKQAIIIMILIAIGIAIPPIYIGQYFAISIGGFIIPYALCIYMLISCGWSRDLLRATIGTIIVAGVIYALDWLLPSDTPQDIIIDNMFLYGIVAGIVAYALGRSRRNAFICAVFGISTAQSIQWGINMMLGTPTVLGLGVGGAFGTYVIAILIAVGLAEFLGRAFTNAKPDEQKKEFNFDTHTYDSEKNGKLVVSKETKDKTHNDINAVVESKKSKEINKTISKENIKTDKSKNTKKYNNSKNSALKSNNKSDDNSDASIKNNKNTHNKNIRNKSDKSKKVIATSIAILMIACSSIFAGFYCPKCKHTYAADTAQSGSYYTVYDYKNKSEVILTKGGLVENGDLYLSSDNKLYEIINVDTGEKIAYAKFIRDEELPNYNVTSKYAEQLEQSDTSTETSKKSVNSVALSKPVAYAKSQKYVGIYHTHNDESYFTPDGTDSVYAKGGIHDVGASLVKNLNSLDIKTEYNESLHLPHNSGAYTRSQTTAKKLIDSGVTAIFDVHRDSTPRKEYYTTVNGKEMSKVRMVIGSSNQNYAENKNFAYSIKAYADKVYPNFIKDIYMGGGNYNQQLSGFALLFEMGSENIEKDLAIASTTPLAKIIDVVLFGSENASSSSMQDVVLGSSGASSTNVITGLSNSGTGASLTSLWVLLAVIAISLVVLGIACIFSKNARYKTARFFSELFGGLFGKKKAKLKAK